ncbi:YecA family protein [Prosthecochloris sp. ZM]|uniref:UPF0149 family protein n=1 Tax=Prosthecochloris sp. ZM TaxID=2283143 RepID=UPI000DF76947|nr:UPF0149 family protein [Prosthecochloris sp. ZM]RDD30278.1 YecA family protein [Prosthecochloris sp. ZM]
MNSSDELMQPVSAEELVELEDFLLSEKTSENAMTLDMVDGYLTAIVVGPTTPLPDDWMPYIWGMDDDKAPEFDSDEEARRLTLIILRYMNTIAGALIDNPDAYLPLFDRCTYANQEDEDLAVESWAYAFAMGIELTREEWKPLFDDDEASGLLLPIFILGKIGEEWDDIAKEELDEWRDAVVEAVAGIYEFWLSDRFGDGE